MTEETKLASILIVDDTPANLEVLQDMLASSGFELLIAINGESAIKQAEYANPDIILLDVMMPGIDGFETCRRLKTGESTRDIPVIFMTALSDTADKVQGFGVGGVDYVTKPLQHEEVLARIDTHLTLRNLQRELQAVNEGLEKRVEERTAELSDAYDQLHKAHRQLEHRVRELDGRDRLVHLQMRSTSLDKAYEEIVSVVKQVLDVKAAALYVPDAGLENLILKNAVGVFSSEASVSLDDAGSALARTFTDHKPRSAEPERDVVPILYGEAVQGVLCVEGMEVEDEEERQTKLNTLWSMAQEAALLLRVARVTTDLADGVIEIDELLEID